MPLDPYYAKALLDWTTGAATVTAPTGRYLNWVTASPSYSSSFEGMYTPRLTALFCPAISPQGSATNTNAPTGTATAVATALGWNLYDAAAAGHRIMYGPCTAAIGCASGNNISFGAGNLNISIVLV